MQFAIVVNARAGAVVKRGGCRVRQLITDRLGAQLASLRIVPPRALPAALEEALASKPDAVVVLGGDGTARGVVARLGHAGIPTSFLPGGTMNILSRRLYGEASIEDVLDRLAAGTLEDVRLGIGVAGGEPFLVAATFGFLPLLAHIREEMRRSAGPGEAWRTAMRLLRLGPRLFAPRVHFAAEGGVAGRASALVVSLGNADGLHPWRDDPDDFDQFECVGLDIASWRSLAGFSLRAMTLPNWRDDPRCRSFSSVDLTLQNRRIPLTLDGEPMHFRGPLRLRASTIGLRAMAYPRQAQNMNSHAAHRTSLRPSPSLSS